MSDFSVAIVGGDLRFVRLCQILVEAGIDTWIYALEHPDLPSAAHHASSLDIIGDCDYVIGPIPFTRDGKNLSTPLSNRLISIELFLESTRKSYLCLSVLSDTIKAHLDHRNFQYIDVMSMDEIAILNAIPTAEGAIQYAMQNSEITLHGSKCLVLGFGRCGKILAHKLKGIGADVSIEARKTKDLAYISTYGCFPIPLNELANFIEQYDFIFNTIPVPLLGPQLIDLMQPHTVYIELASPPYGIHFDYAKQKGIHTVLAPSLPGKVAPLSAAKILYKCLCLIIENRRNHTL